MRSSSTPVTALACMLALASLNGCGEEQTIDERMIGAWSTEDPRPATMLVLAKDGTFMMSTLVPQTSERRLSGDLAQVEPVSTYSDHTESSGSLMQSYSGEWWVADGRLVLSFQVMNDQPLVDHHTVRDRIVAVSDRTIQTESRFGKEKWARLQ